MTNRDRMPMEEWGRLMSRVRWLAFLASWFYFALGYAAISAVAHVLEPYVAIDVKYVALVSLIILGHVDSAGAWLTDLMRSKKALDTDPPPTGR